MSDCGCPILKEKDWDYIEHKWKDKPFYVKSMLTFFHMPLGMESFLKDMVAEMTKKGYQLSYPVMIMQECKGLFHADMLVGVKNYKILDKNVKMLNGNFISHYCTGEYKNIGKWMKDFKHHLKEMKKKEPTNYYMWYVDCPKCWNKHGGPQTVIFAKV